MSARQPNVTGVHEARQARSQATHEAILDAALAAVREVGPEAFTLSDVVARAQCTTGAVYGRFRDKDALLLALYERLVEQWIARLRAGFAALSKGGDPLEEGLRRLIAAQIRVRRREWGLRNAFLSRIINRQDFRSVSARLLRESADLLAQALAARRLFRKLSQRELQQRAGLAIVMIGASLERAIALRHDSEGRLPADDAALANALAAATVALFERPE